MPLLRGLFRGLRDDGPGQLHQLSDAFRLHALFREVVGEVSLRGAVCVHAPAVYRDGDFLRGDLLHPKSSGHVPQPAFENTMVERLVMLVGAVVEDADNLVLGLLLILAERGCVEPVASAGDFPDVLVFQSDGEVFTRREAVEGASHYAPLSNCVVSGKRKVRVDVVLKLVNIVTALLPLVIEIELGDSPAVKRVLAAVELLGAVDVPEANEVEFRRRQGGRVDHRLKLAKKCRLPALHIAACDGEVRHQYRRDTGNTFRLEAHNHVLDSLGEYLVLLLLGEAGVLGPVVAPVEAGDAGDLHFLPAFEEVGTPLWPVYDVYHIVAPKRAFQRGELLRTVVVGGAAHDDHFADTRKLPQEAHRRLLLLEAPVAPYPRLMEDVSGDNRNVRLLLPRPGHQRVEAAADVEEANVFAVLLRAGEIPDMQVACVQNSDSHY